MKFHFHEPSETNRVSHPTSFHSQSLSTSHTSLSFSFLSIPLILLSYISVQCTCLGFFSHFHNPLIYISFAERNYYEHFLKYIHFLKYLIFSTTFWRLAIAFISSSHPGCAPKLKNSLSELITQWPAVGWMYQNVLKMGTLQKHSRQASHRTFL